MWRRIRRAPSLVPTRSTSFRPPLRPQPRPIPVRKHLVSTVAERSSFILHDFDAPAQVVSCGAAQAAGGVLRLAPAQPRQVGASWYAERVSVAAGFTTDFRFLLSEQGGAADEYGCVGADGFAFVVQNAGIVVGKPGHGMGYDGIARSLAVEFDTCCNLSQERSYTTADVNPDGSAATGDHVSVQTRGLQPNSAFHAAASRGWTTRRMRLAEPWGGPRQVRVVYRPGGDGERPRIRVFLDGDHGIPVLEVPLGQRLEALLGLPDGRAWIGFTAATGAGWQNHDILSWSYLAHRGGSS